MRLRGVQQLSDRVVVTVLLVHYVRALGDTEILKPHFLSGRTGAPFGAFLDRVSLRCWSWFGRASSFSRLGDLIERADHVLSQLDRVLGHLGQYKLGVDERHIRRAK